MPAKPKLGQHFLHDVEAIEHITASIGDMTGRTVVEIGPGQGAITAALVARAAHVVAIEYDPRLAESARAYLRPWPNVTVHHGDGADPGAVDRQRDQHDRQDHLEQCPQHHRHRIGRHHAIPGGRRDLGEQLRQSG